MPACEPDLNPSPTAPIPALACFQLRLRDSMDFTVDFTNWLAQNGNSSTLITGVVWATATGSPKTPTIVSQAFSPQGKCSVILAAPAGTVAGAAFWLDVTITIGPTAVVDTGDVQLPARTITRRINVVTVNG